MKVPRSRGDDYTVESVARRLELCEQAAGMALPHLAGRPVAPSEARGKIENLVGFAQVPLGISGPLRVETHRGAREVFVPFATTEGAMVASYARGMKLLTAAGTARARVVHEGLSQHPMLVYADAAAAERARAAVPELRAELEALTASCTNHGRLVAVEPELAGRRLILRLVFTTGDAIGINMAARAAELCSERVARET